MKSSDPEDKLGTTAERHRKILVILTVAGVTIPLLLAALRLLGYI